MLLFSLIILGISIFISIKSYSYYKKSQEIKEEKIVKEQKNKEEILEQIEQQRKELNNIRKEKELTLKEKESLTDQNNIIKQQINDLTSSIKKIEEEQKQSVNEQVEQYRKEQYEKAQQDLDDFLNKSYLQKQDITSQIAQEENSLLDLKNKQQVINEAILRKKEIAEQTDFYRIIITEDEKQDIAALLEVENRIKNKEAIRRLIWDLYIKRPLGEMEKRVLKNQEISGIYKITNIETEESYIGKSTNIKTRWVNHLKTVIGLDGAAHSTLHTRMEKDGFWNYSFEVLEEVEKSQLSSREAYWINFYDTKKYGLNMKEGSYGT